MPPLHDDTEKLTPPACSLARSLSPRLVRPRSHHQLYHASCKTGQRGTTQAPCRRVTVRSCQGGGWGWSFGGKGGNPLTSLLIAGPCGHPYKAPSVSRTAGHKLHSMPRIGGVRREGVGPKPTARAKRSSTVLDTGKGNRQKCQRRHAYSAQWATGNGVGGATWLTQSSTPHCDVMAIPRPPSRGFVISALQD